MRICRVCVQWNECQSHYKMPCGPGQQRRPVSCPVGSKLRALCVALQPQPFSVLACDLPCFGDCKMSEWSEWTPCNCRGRGGQRRSRVRAVLEAALPSGRQCGADRQTEECECREYTVRTDNWTSCVIHIQNVTCGLGENLALGLLASRCTGERFDTDIASPMCSTHIS